MRGEVDETIKNMIDEGIIERAVTAYLNPIVVVKKKDGKVRICLDARRINEVTIPENEAPQNLDEILWKFNKTKIFSALDFSSSYWQIAIHPDDRKFTGFLYNGLTYIWKRMPFGLRNSGAAFIRCLDEKLGDKIKQFVTPYIDDIVISSQNFQEHLCHLEQLLECLSNNDMRLNLNKSQFCTSEISFLGYRVNTDGVKIDPDKVQAIDQISRPRSTKQLKGFLGMCVYQSRFIPGYAILTAPLVNLLRKGTKWHWTDEHEQAFNKIKAAFRNAIMVNHPDFSEPFYLQTDSSNVGIGCVLTQMGELDTEFKIVAVASRVLRSNELKYSVTEKEALSIIWALQKMLGYLAGRKFYIVTDHKALIFLKRCHCTNARLLRWVLWLQQFDFDIRHCPGINNPIADFLSRLPYASNHMIQNDTVYHMNVINLNVTPIPEMRPVNLQKLQEQDAIIGKAKLFIQNSLDQSDPLFEKLTQNPGLVKLSSNLVMFRTKAQPCEYRIWIPNDITDKLIIHVHQKHGHFGGNKILKILMTFAYWKGMARHVRATVSKCVTCQLTKFPNRHYEGTMHHIIPSAPNELACLDLYGPLPTARYGYKHVLVVSDSFSKFTQIYPITRPTAQNCLNRLTREFFRTAGKYKKILSDHASQFTGTLWKQTLENEGVSAIFSSIRHPQSNPSERIMREISRLFRVYVTQNHKEWPLLIKHINEWINTVEHDSIGMSPYEAHFGRKPEHAFPLLARLSGQPVPNYENRCRIILDNLTKNARRREAAVKNPYQFKIGDKVLVRTPRVSDQPAGLFHKFFPLFSGPFTVEAIPHPNVCLLKDVNGVPAGKFNFYNLRPFKD